MIAIGPASAADIPALVALDSFAAIHPERATEIAGWVAAGQCHVAAFEGRAAGYAVLTNGFFHRPFLEMLMVREDARRLGIARALVGYCADLAGPELWTSTNESNGPMRTLLSTCGFIASGRVDNLDPGDPEVVYLLRR